MNTSKQVNVMIGVVLLSILLFGGYMLNESNRQADAEEHVTERVAERGARLFVNNCRNCHGLSGEGHIGPALNTGAFLILDEDNEYGAEPTAEGVADGIRDFLHDTIACGRQGTFMPAWSQDYRGPLSDTQINQIVTMITEGRWDLVEEIGAEHDAETASTAADILMDPSGGVAVNESTCGQFAEEDLAAFRERDPFAPPETGEPSPTPEATEEPEEAGAGGGLRVVLDEFSVTPAQPSTATGSVTFDVQNDGAVAHELTVIKSDLAPDTLPVQANAVNEDAVDVIGTTPDIPSEGSEDLTVTLSAGRYVLVCQVPGHYGAGMRAGFTVQ
jgi:uncharacterized cupredoxin-like copper-binding protein/mono/diheme cytochrome c family protein